MSPKFDLINGFRERRSFNPRKLKTFLAGPGGGGGGMSPIDELFEASHKGLIIKVRIISLETHPNLGLKLHIEYKGLSGETDFLEGVTKKFASRDGRFAKVKVLYVPPCPEEKKFRATLEPWDEPEAAREAARPADAAAARSISQQKQEAALDAISEREGTIFANVFRFNAKNSYSEAADALCNSDLFPGSIVKILKAVFETQGEKHIAPLLQALDKNCSPLAREMAKEFGINFGPEQKEALHDSGEKPSSDELATFVKARVALINNDYIETGGEELINDKISDIWAKAALYNWTAKDIAEHISMLPGIKEVGFLACLFEKDYLGDRQALLDSILEQSATTPQDLISRILQDKEYAVAAKLLAAPGRDVPWMANWIEFFYRAERLDIVTFLDHLSGIMQGGQFDSLLNALGEQNQELSHLRDELDKHAIKKDLLKAKQEHRPVAVKVTGRDIDGFEGTTEFKIEYNGVRGKTVRAKWDPAKYLSGDGQSANVLIIEVSNKGFLGTLVKHREPGGKQGQPSQQADKASAGPKLSLDSRYYSLNLSAEQQEYLKSIINLTTSVLNDLPKEDPAFIALSSKRLVERFTAKEAAEVLFALFMEKQAAKTTVAKIYNKIFEWDRYYADQMWKEYKELIGENEEKPKTEQRSAPVQAPPKPPKKLSREVTETLKFIRPILMVNEVPQELLDEFERPKKPLRDAIEYTIHHLIGERSRMKLYPTVVENATKMMKVFRNTGNVTDAIKEFCKEANWR